MHVKALSAPSTVASDAQTLQTGWRVIGLSFLISVLCVLGLFWQTIEKMGEMWASSRTFAHGFLILPATVYLLWSYRALWIRHEAYPSVWGLSASFMTACAWLIGRATEVVWLQEMAVIATIPALMLALFGKDVTKTVAWPLGFLIFMLPVGTSVEPWLQDIAAWFIRIGLEIVGIPYLYSSHRFILATGTWTVDPDCAGLRYLLPGLALGYAFVTLMYRHPRRRVLFLAICAVVLVVANGMRAYAIIIGDHFGIADGTDHRVFSYAVYGFTMPLVLWLGLKWEDSLQPSTFQQSTARTGEDVSVRAILMGITAVVVLALAPLTFWLMGPPV